MVFQYIPSPNLKHLISKITLVRYQFDKSLPRIVNPFPPQPDNCLYFYPYDKIICRNYAEGSLTTLPGSILVGPQLSRIDLTLGYDMLVIIVHFCPGGMHRLLHIPMEEMIGRPFDASLILGSEIHEITERLGEAADFNKMIFIIQQYFTNKINKIKSSIPVELVLAQMMQQKLFWNVDQLAKNSCVSTRQLERQINERTGMSPKLFLKLIRFSRAWIMREKCSSLSWTKIAHACGYADQMHLIRDFKQFSGVTPGMLQTDLEKSTLRLQAESIS